MGYVYYIPTIVGSQVFFLLLWYNYFIMSRLLYESDNFKLETGGQEVFSEEQILSSFSESFKELRKYCNLSLMKLSENIGIPNQTLSSYETKTRTPSMIQAIKITAYFGLTVEEFILCGLEKLPYDITELYEKRKKEL